jgi:hypothetical protein
MPSDDIWPTKDIESWDELETVISKKSYRDWLFRGHSDIDWKLESSLFRLFNDTQAILPKSRRFAKDRHEEELIRVFKSHAHLFITNLPDKNNKLEWLALMQHYGTPTRLLDMTFSPYIAAFFALENGQEDCCIYSIKHTHFTEIDENHFKNQKYKESIFKDQRGEKSFFIPFEPEMKNERIVAQQGVFLVSSTNYETYDKILSNYEFSKNEGIKYILKKKMRYEGLKKLRLMNISSATLFPGIDGFCKSLRFQVLDTIQRIRRLG